VLDWLLSTEGFVPRKACGAWTPELIGLHSGSDILIWLAYLSIPLVLAFFAWRKPLGRYKVIVLLFAAFILFCGFTHLVDAVMFERPMYRLGGVLKAMTAVVSWATVFALIAIVPRLMTAFARVPDTSFTMPTLDALQRSAPSDEVHTGITRYIVAILASVLAVLVRAMLDPVLAGDHVYVLPLLAVVYVAWNSGFKPGLVTLFTSMAAIVFIFVPPEYSFIKTRVSDYIAIGMFLFAGVGCSLLGEAQRRQRRRAIRHLAIAQDRQRELEELTVKLAAAQQQTAEALAQLDTFVMNAPLGLAIVDPELRFVRVNNQLAQTAGKDVAELLGRPLTEVTPNLAADAVADYRRVLETGEPLVDQLVFSGDDPTSAERVWQSSYYPVRLPDGRLQGVGLVTKEITQQIRAERALRESEARFRALAETMPQFVWVARPDGTREYFNTKWSNYTGQSIKSSLNQGWLSPLHPDDRVRAEERWRESVIAGEPFENERRFRDASGQYRWFLGRALPHRDDTGAVVRWFGTDTDIEDSKDAQTTMSQSLERFRALTEAIPSIVFTAAPDGTVDYFNRQWYDYTGRSGAPADLSWAEAIYPDELAALSAKWFGSMANASEFESEFRLRRNDGAFRWHQTRALAVRVADGGISQWIGTITDVEDHRQYSHTLEREVGERTVELSNVVAALQAEVEIRGRSEKAAEAAALELRRSNSELEQFAYVASHDLQEPLRKIQAFGSRIQTNYGPQLGEVGTDYLDRVLNSASRMRQLIEDLLTFSRVTSNAQPFGSVDLRAIADGVLADLEIRIVQTQATVDLGPLPTIKADPLQMRQLFQNLIGNSLKFRKPEVVPEIRVTAELVAEEIPRWILKFSDNGIGFDEKYRDRIFQVFQRLHGRGEYEGTGVGLAICRKIAERHGGSITATSRLGEGATFIVSFPVRSHPNPTPSAVSNA